MENKSIKVCVIGAGFSGLCMAIKLKTELGINSFTIFKANEEVGGCWFVNTYPGCSSDTTSQLYSFSFEPDYDWSHGCPSQPEILDYLKHVAKKYELYPHLRFNTKVETLKWNESEQKWHATILDTRRNKTETEVFDIVIGGTGKSRYPHYPQEYLGFKGPVIHTAEWDASIPLEGKRVGIVGSQASAVQLTASIASKVKSLTIFQREAPHIIPRWWQWRHSSLTRLAFKTFPLLRLFIRFLWFWAFELLLYPATKYGSVINKLVQKYVTWHRESTVKDKILLKKVTPKSLMLCKRIVPHESYYEALNLQNVEVITERIKEVSGNCLMTEDGKNFELDVLILATGFQTTEFFAPMKIYGKGGVDVLQLWKKERPQGYLGTAYQVMPNFFNILGPYTEIGHGSTVFIAECQADWIILGIKELQKRRMKSMTLKRETEVEFMKWHDKKMQNTTWIVGKCTSWYLDKEGRNVMLWAGNQLEFYWLCRKFRPEMFEFC